MDAADILSYNAELAKYVLENPTESLPLVCSLIILPGYCHPHKNDVNPSTVPCCRAVLHEGHACFIPGKVLD